MFSNKGIRCFFYSIVFIVLLIVLTIYQKSSILLHKNSTTRPFIEPNFLDGCYHVYLDVGSNVGIQVRKLYEPEKYPNARVHELFNSHFGSIEEIRLLTSNLSGAENFKTVCAVGFEPNSNHTERLKSLEKSYKKCGWFVRFFTESAVSDREGVGQFYTDEDQKALEWGGGILPPDVITIAKNRTENYKQVRLIRLASFIREVVATRKITPRGNISRHKPPGTFMKIILPPLPSPRN